RCLDFSAADPAGHAPQIEFGTSATLGGKPSPLNIARLRADTIVFRHYQPISSVLRSPSSSPRARPRHLPPSKQRSLALRLHPAAELSPRMSRIIDLTLPVTSDMIGIPKIAFYNQYPTRVQAVTVVNEEQRAALASEGVDVLAEAPAIGSM